MRGEKKGKQNKGRKTSADKGPDNLIRRAERRQQIDKMKEIDRLKNASKSERRNVFNIIDKAITAAENDGKTSCRISYGELGIGGGDDFASKAIRMAYNHVKTEIFEKRGYKFKKHVDYHDDDTYDTFVIITWEKK